MPLPKEHTYTIKDIYALPEGERAELIDGQIYMMGAPTYLHQALSMELSANYPELYSQQKRFLSGSAGPIGCHTFFRISLRGRRCANDCPL